jgi:uncharacterized OB-fold protein
MDYGASYQLAVFGIIVILTVSVSFISSSPVFAGGYEKSQIISQTNECGNYWFPLNIICSNLNSQAQGEENEVAMATTTPNSDTKVGTPFP